MDEKCFRNFRIQIRLLKSRGVKIKNKRIAKKMLASLNYYDLINGYKGPFLISTSPTDIYKSGTCFEEILALYEFDRKLRLITLEVLLQLEDQIKTIVAYTFSKEHGHKDYLLYSNFDSKGKNKYKQVGKLLSELYNNISNNIDKDMITHYVDGKNYVPLWVLVNSLSFGNISRFYSVMVQKEREEVAKRIKWGVREHDLKNILHFLGAIRNVCAHGERFYIYKNYVDLNDNSIFKYFRYRRNKNNFFAVIVALKLILTKESFNKYFNDLENLCNILKNSIRTIRFKDIIYMMGLPSNWKMIKKL